MEDALPHPAVWRGEELFARADWEIVLPENEPPSLPTLLPKLAGIRESLEHGSGAVRIRGLPVEDWDAETLRLIDWFKTATPPAERFELCSGVTILDPARWWLSIEGDIGCGPDGPRARYGAVQGDLRKLHDRMSAEDAEYDRLEREAIQNESSFDNARPPGDDGGTIGDRDNDR